jgi:hypothetical protein
MCYGTVTHFLKKTDNPYPEFNPVNSLTCQHVTLRCDIRSGLICDYTVQCKTIKFQKKLLADGDLWILCALRKVQNL